MPNEIASDIEDKAKMKDKVKRKMKQDLIMACNMRMFIARFFSCLQFEDVHCKIKDKVCAIYLNE